MKLHTNKDAYEELLTLASEKSGIERYKVEKDYWVCKMLRETALSEHGDKVYFKGGTSLSKGYGLIDRFSEREDVVPWLQTVFPALTDLEFSTIKGKLHDPQTKRHTIPNIDDIPKFMTGKRS